MANFPSPVIVSIEPKKFVSFTFTVRLSESPELYFGYGAAMKCIESWVEIIKNTLQISDSSGSETEKSTSTLSKFLVFSICCFTSWMYCINSSSSEKILLKSSGTFVFSAYSRVIPVNSEREPSRLYSASFILYDEAERAAYESNRNR